ncbi:MAG TPA: hypothetical protein VHE30_19005 [Polyangiaceae bacterium]|nr:hypothetical protein [Polyangiaceae bacterium]
MGDTGTGRRRAAAVGCAFAFAFASPSLGGCGWIIGEGDHHLREEPPLPDADAADLGDQDATVGAPVLLAHDDGIPGVVTTDGTTAFWVREASASGPGAILGVPQAGGDKFVVASGLQRPTGVRADAAYVYYTDDRVGADGGASGLFRVDKTGGAPELVDRDDAGFGWLSLYGGWLYSAGTLPDGTGFVRRSDKLGNSPQAPCHVAESVGAIPIMSVGATGIFFYDAGRQAILFAKNACDAGATVFAESQSDVHVTTFGAGFLYWTTSTTIFRQPTNSPGAPDVVRDGQGGYGIDSGPGGVYFTNQTTGVIRNIDSTLRLRTLATGQSAPHWISVSNDRRVIWANRGSGDIMKLDP